MIRTLIPGNSAIYFSTLMWRPKDRRHVQTQISQLSLTVVGTAQQNLIAWTANFPEHALIKRINVIVYPASNQTSGMNTINCALVFVQNGCSIGTMAAVNDPGPANTAFYDPEDNIIWWSQNLSEWRESGADPQNQTIQQPFREYNLDIPVELKVNDTIHLVAIGKDNTFTGTVLVTWEVETLRLR